MTQTLRCLMPRMTSAARGMPNGSRPQGFVGVVVPRNEIEVLTEVVIIHRGVKAHHVVRNEMVRRVLAEDPICSRWNSTVASDGTGRNSSCRDGIVAVAALDLPRQGDLRPVVVFLAPERRAPRRVKRVERAVLLAQPRPGTLRAYRAVAAGSRRTRCRSASRSRRDARRTAWPWSLRYGGCGRACRRC